MKMVHGLRTLLSRLSLLLLVIVSLQAKTLKVDTVTASVTNGDFTVTPNGTGDIVLGSFSGVLKSTAGVLSVSDIDLTSEVSGILAIASGGTGSATQVFVDLTTDQSIAGVKTLTGKLVTSSTTNGSVPAPIMTGAERDAIGSPSAGDQVFNSTTNALNVYNGVSWVAVGGGGGGLDVYHKEDYEGAVKATDFSTGTGGWLAGGTIDGALSDETSSPIAGLSSLKYIQGASSVGDYAASPIITLESKQKDNQSYVTLYYTHDGDAEDIKFVIYDVTNTNELDNGLILVDQTSKATRKSATFYLPSTVTTIRYGFEVLVSNSGSILVIDDVEFTTKPIITAPISETESIRFDTVTGYSSSNTKIPYYTNSYSDNYENKFITVTNNSTDGLSIEVLRDNVEVKMHIVANTTSGAVYGASINASGAELDTSIGSLTGTVKSLGVGRADSTNGSLAMPISLIANFGDILRPHYDGDTINVAGRHSILITATAQNPAVVVASETSETTTKILSADVTSTGDISDLTFTGLDIGSLYNVSGMLNLGLVSSDIIGAFRDTASAGGAILSGVNYNVSSATVNGTRWVSFQFKATTTNMYLNLSTAGGTVRGDGSRSESFIQLTNITSQFLTAIPTRKDQLDLVDGVTVPATDTSLGRVYIDSADGDLKIKFGDGTIKTIVTD